jgi:hypothetical protein
MEWRDIGNVRKQRDFELCALLHSLATPFLVG